MRKELETEPETQENKEFEISEYIGYSFDISKTEETSEGVIIEGYASTRDRDRQKDVVLPEAFQKSLPEYMDNPVVLFNHKRDVPIGKTISADIDAKGLYVKCEINDKTYAQKAKNGELRAFSWVGQANKAYEGKSDKGEKTRFITDASLYEISVVTIPANQKSLFRVAKSLDDFIEKEPLEKTMTIEEIQAAMKAALAESNAPMTAQLEEMKKELEATKNELKAEVAKNFVEGQRKGTQSSAPAFIVKNAFKTEDDIIKAVEDGRTEEVEEVYSDHSKLNYKQQRALFNLTKEMLLDGMKDAQGNKYISKISSGNASTSTFNHLTPTLWSPQLERTLRRRSVLMPTLLENNDLLGVPGDTIYIPTLPDTTGIFGSLTEGTDMTINHIDADSSVTLVPTEYGGALGFTRKVLDRLGYDGLASAMDQTAYDAAKYMNAQVAALYTGLETATSEVFPGSSATSIATLTSTDTMDDQALLNAQLAFRKIDADSYDNGNYQLYLSPKQWNDFQGNSQIRSDIHYARPTYIVAGENQGNSYVGTWHNIDIYCTNYILSSTTGTTGALPVYKALLLSPRWAVIGWKRKLSMVVDPTLYDMGRRRQFGITADYQIKLLHSDRAFVLETA